MTAILPLAVGPQSFVVTAYYLVVVGVLLLVLLRKRDASAVLGWTLAIVFLPVVGLLAFVVFGGTRVPRRLKRKVRHRKRFRQQREARVAAEPRGLETPEPHVLEDWQRIGDVVRALGEPPRREGHEVVLLEEGTEAFREIFAAIDAAEHHVHVLMYIFRDDGLGKHFVERLIDKVRAGVEVRVIVDAVGSLGGRRLFRHLEGAGGGFAVFLPLLPFVQRFRPNLRNHRKIVIVDGKVGFFGGLNIGEEYLGRRRHRRDWKDLHVRLRGPAVRDLQRIFVEDWDFCASELLEGRAYFPPPEKPGTAPVQIVSGGPDQDTNAVRQTFFSAITRARRRLYVATPYVVPDAAIRDALKNASLGGADVRILSQGWPPDQYLPYICGWYYYEELLAAGVRVYEYQEGMMHAKMMVADGVWAMAGTANLDNRSLNLNFELMGIFDGREEVRAMERQFLAWLEGAKEIELEAYRDRPWYRQAIESTLRLVSPLM